MPQGVEAHLSGQLRQPNPCWKAMRNVRAIWKHKLRIYLARGTLQNFADQCRKLDDFGIAILRGREDQHSALPIYVVPSGRQSSDRRHPV